MVLMQLSHYVEVSHWTADASREDGLLASQALHIIGQNIHQHGLGQWLILYHILLNLSSAEYTSIGWTSSDPVG